MKGAIYADLGQYSFELMKSSLEAAVNAETASVAAGNPSYAKALALTSDKIVPIFGTAGATLESVSEGIRAVEALQREDAEAYAKSAGRSLSGVIQATLFATNRGFPGAAAGPPNSVGS